MLRFLWTHFMNSEMSIENVFVGKLFSTHVALKLAYSSVSYNMSLHIPLTIETLSAIGTVKSIDPLVEWFDVLVQVADVAEDSVA